MAIEKQLILSNGIEGNYWKNTEVIINDTGQARRVLAGFVLWKNDEIRNSDGPLPVSENRNWVGDDFPLDIKLSSLGLSEDASVWDAVRTVVYNKLKLTNPGVNQVDFTTGTKDI